MLHVRRVDLSAEGWPAAPGSGQASELASGPTQRPPRSRPRSSSGHLGSTGQARHSRWSARPSRAAAPPSSHQPTPPDPDARCPSLKSPSRAPLSVCAKMGARTRMLALALAPYPGVAMLYKHVGGDQDAEIASRLSSVAGSSGRRGGWVAQGDSQEAGVDSDRRNLAQCGARVPELDARRPTALRLPGCDLSAAESARRKRRPADNRAD